MDKIEKTIQEEHTMEREEALHLLQKYNREPFHILHALTVEGVMRWFAQEMGDRKSVV